MNIGFLITKIIRLIFMRSKLKEATPQPKAEETIDIQKILDESKVEPKQTDTSKESPISQELQIIPTMNYSDHYELNHLVLERFCGEEEYPVISTEYSIIDGDEEDGELYSLWLEMCFSEGTKLHDDTKDLNQSPNWEVSFFAPSIKKEDLKPGYILEFENEEQDSEAIMYYCEHEPTLNNKMEIMEVNGDELLIKVLGFATDINFYDGSKPQNQLRVLAWFKPKAAGK